jgi:hypothetical protein
MPTERLVTDALMVAGGPSGNADLKEIKIERGDRPIWRGQPLQDAITEGRTLDQLSVRAGDRIVVPAQRQRVSAWRNGLVVLSAVSTVVLAVERISRWF